MSSVDKPNAIFISFDDAYFHYAKSCLHSLSQYYPNHPEILIDYQGNSDQIVQYLAKIPHSKLIKISSDYQFDLGIIQKPIIYNRFSLWSDVFSQYNNILHLDVDTLVLQPLSELFSYKEFWIASDNHPDANIFLKDDNLFYKSFQVDADPELDEKLLQDGVDISSNSIPMGNAGIFLIPPEYRTTAYHKQLLNIAERYHKHCTYADQSIISLWCFFNKIPIQNNFRFNCQVRFLYANQPTTIHDAAIIHFTGQSKSVEYYSSLPELQKNIHELLHQLRQYFRLPRNELTFTKELVDTIDSLQKQNSPERILPNRKHSFFGLDKVIEYYLATFAAQEDFAFCLIHEISDIDAWLTLTPKRKVILVIDEIYCDFESIRLNQKVIDFIKFCYRVICSDFNKFLLIEKINPKAIYLPTAFDTNAIPLKDGVASSRCLIVCEPNTLSASSDFYQLNIPCELFVINDYSTETLLSLQGRLLECEFAVDLTLNLQAWVLLSAKMGVVVFGSTQNDYLRSCFPYTTFQDSTLIQNIINKFNSLKSNNLELEFIRELAVARVERFNPANLGTKLGVLLGGNMLPSGQNNLHNKYFNFPDNIHWISGRTELSVAKHEFSVFTLVKNGEGYIQHWLQHYTNLGASYFLIVDNMSTDKTCELLAANPKVTLFKTDLDFRLYENDIRNYMVSRYCHGMWCLSVDIDEFFDFPDSDRISMFQFLDYQNQRGFTAVLSYMQDMLPGPTKCSENFIKEHQYIDNQMTGVGMYASLQRVYSKYNQFTPDTRFCFGGVRSQCFGGDKSQTLLLKHSLTFQDGILEPHTDPHFCDKAKISDVGSVLLHYKFTDFFAPKMTERANNKIFNYYSQRHYQHYEKFLSIHAINESSSVCTYAGVQSLVDSGFINTSKNYQNHVENLYLNQSSNMKNPLISCLCVTSNRAPKLHKAIECFYAQTYPAKELIVICDSNDRDTLDLLRQVASEKIKVFDQPDMNRLPIGELRNIAITKAAGDYVCTWDDDDWYNVDRLEIQYAALHRHQKAACLLTKIFILDSVNDASFLAYPRLWENSLLVNRNFLLENKIFYPAVRRGEDYLLVDKLVAANAVYPLEEPMLYIYRVSGQNTWPMEHFNHVTKKCQRVSEYQHIVLKKAFDESVTPEEASRKIYSNYFLSNICYVEPTEDPRP